MELNIGEVYIRHVVFTSVLVFGTVWYGSNKWAYAAATGFATFMVGGGIASIIAMLHLIQVQLPH